MGEVTLSETMLDALDSESVDVDLFIAWCEEVSLATADEGDIYTFSDTYEGEYESIQDFAQQVAERSGNDLSVWPYTCIDWSDAAHDLMLDYYVIDGHNGVVHIFNAY